MPQMPALSQIDLPQPSLWTPPEGAGIFSSSFFMQLCPALAGAGAAVLLASFFFLLLQEPKLDVPYPNGKYDARDAEAFFAERPGALLFRTADLFRLGLRFGVQLLLDWRFGRIDQNQPKRAKELTRLLTDCGATFIKIGQALSIRTDLLSPAYIESLSELQDRVPAFSNAQAFETIRKELRLPSKSPDTAGEMPECFTELSAKPVAAASLGQVYRARLRDSGLEVAVKVQRPGVLEAVALDMYLIRMAAVFAKRTFGWINTDLVAAVDEWALRFVDELDYELEAQSAINFREQIAITPLAKVVCAPRPVLEYSSKRVLTAEWVQGQRLDAASNSKGDVGKLCSVGLTAYLTMLLETGTLHCDPHPGNLLVTDDGQLCILDWGLTTKVEGELQITFLEHIAHLTSRDYPAIPGDLVRLGFVPEAQQAAIAQAGVAEVLGTLYAQLAGGGGAKKIDVTEVARTMTGLTQNYGNMFQLPAYFLYVLRAFTVLEGIGLQNDPDYSIVDQCLPYITQRLVTDNSPRSRAALRSFVSSAAATGGNARQVDGNRALLLVSGLSDYNAATLGLNAPSGEDEDAVTIAAKLVLDARGNPLQSLLLEETARAADALVRDMAVRVDELLERSGPAARVLDPLGAWGMMRQLLVKEEEDEEMLRGVAAIFATFEEGREGDAALPPARSSAQHAAGSHAGKPPPRPAPSSGLSPEVRNKLAQQVWEQRAGAGMLAQRLAARMLLRASERLGRLSEPGVVDGKARDEFVVVLASLGKTATALTAAQLAAFSKYEEEDEVPTRR
mmetsp:Transcript_32240/g.80286  ORF Transcript_32240/g.80286 Transcript_32240/m.80286 type:complete len:790 (+) Transcript_32240:471-2840(+)